MSLFWGSMNPQGPAAPLSLGEQAQQQRAAAASEARLALPPADGVEELPKPYLAFSNLRMTLDTRPIATVKVITKAPGTRVYSVCYPSEGMFLNGRLIARWMAQVIDGGKQHGKPQGGRAA